MQTSSAESPTRTPLLDPRDIATALNLPWSHYVRLLSVQNHEARRFYEEEALRGGWTVLSNYGGGADPVSQKIQNLVGRK